MIVNSPSPFNLDYYDNDVKFNSLNNQLNAKYKEVAEHSFETNELETFFNNKEDVIPHNLSQVCQLDSFCDKK